VAFLWRSFLVVAATTSLFPSVLGRRPYNRNEIFFSVLLTLIYTHFFFFVSLAQSSILVFTSKVNSSKS